jgi:hypothetical protein
MVIECRAEDRSDRLLVINLDGTVVREYGRSPRAQLWMRSLPGLRTAGS